MYQSRIGKLLMVTETNTSVGKTLRFKADGKNFRGLLRDKKTRSTIRENLSLIPFDLLVILFVGQSMLPAWAAFLLAAVNFGTWWCYYRIPHFLRTVSGPLGDNILIPGPIVENFASFIYSCGVHHRAHYGLMLAMMAGFHAAMTGFIWDIGISRSLSLYMGWICFAGLLLIDTIMFWVSFRTLQDLRRDSLEDANLYTNELKRSNTDLEQFAYIASHDLRAPLRAMKNLVKWVDEDVNETCSDDTRKHLTLLNGRIERLDKMLNNLLQYSRVGNETADLEYFEIRSKFTDAFGSLNPEGIHKLKVTGNDIWLHDYSVTYEMVAANLISNAIKHNDKDRTEILVDVSRTGNGLQIVVEDNGPGVDEAYRENIFNIFSTGKRRDEVEASGMGLAIVKKIVSEHDGTISVDKSELGGARFVLYFKVPTFTEQPGAA